MAWVTFWVMAVSELGNAVNMALIALYSIPPLATSQIKSIAYHYSALDCSSVASAYKKI
jgi:hypothetical protein